MNKGIIEIYIKYSELDAKAEHFMRWLVGWLYMRGFTLRCVEFECGGCKWYRCIESVEFGLVKMNVESDVDVFDFVLMLGMDLIRLMRSCPMKVKIGICKGGECIDVNMKDVEKWWDEEVWSDFKVRP
jgi:hypothetical protein